MLPTNRDLQGRGCWDSGFPKDGPLPLGQLRTAVSPLDLASPPSGRHQLSHRILQPSEPQSSANQCNSVRRRRGPGSSFLLARELYVEREREFYLVSSE